MTTFPCVTPFDQLAALIRVNAKNATLQAKGEGMQFHAARICGSWLIEPDPATDERGWFARTFCEREFAEHGLPTHFVQHSRSFTRRAGTIRGLHFQSPPFAEEKLVSCVAGAILDVIFDLRPDSPTYMETWSVELSGENGRQLFIPKGVAHGFQALTDNVLVNYLISEFYAPEHARGIRYDDPVLNVRWPLPVATVSERDLSWPRWEPLVPEERSLS